MRWRDQGGLGGQQVAVRREQETRAAAGRLAAPVAHLHGGDAGPHPLSHLCDGLRVSVEQCEVRGSHSLLQTEHMETGSAKRKGVFTVT